MPQAAEMINVAFLTDSERELILQVLHRDEELRQTEEQRVRKLKTELLDIRRKGAKRSSGKYSERSCGRCQEPLDRLPAGSSQCRACKHQVCRKCRTVRLNGSWLCSVCDKEADLKKSTGDWFYDQRVNRFSTTPGHDLVKTSLKKRPPLRKRGTVGEVLLKSAEMNTGQLAPVPRPRLKDLAATNNAEVSEPECKDQVQRSDTESLEKTSLSSVKTETESSCGSPVSPRKEKMAVRSSPAGSSVSSLTAPGKADSSIRSSVSDADMALVVNRACPSPGPSPASLEVDSLFKKSVRRIQKPPEFTSVLDLRGEGDAASQGSMGDRSKSVPGLNAPDEEEDEDIDNLVSIHRNTVASSHSSLRGSKSTLGSLMSIYSEAGDYDSVEVSGDIVFSVTYDEESQTLNVLIKECHGLANGDATKQRTNPYVKCYLLPDKSRQSKKKTSIKRNTVSPTYNETLKYSISRSELVTRSLLISVCHNGRLSRNTFLGEVEVALDCRDLDSTHEECVLLLGKTAPSQSSAFAQYKGELVISLKYVSAKKPPTDTTKGKKSKTEEGGQLHVLIKEAKNLTAMKAGDVSDSFVKGYLITATVKSTKRKTPVVKKTLNPHYDHTFVYKDLSLEQLREMHLELTVWDREALSSNDFMGGVRLSTGTGTLKVGKEELEADSTGEEVSLWQKMMQYPDSWAEGTLPLRCSMGKNKNKNKSK